jgi:hypothetical protein
MQANILHHLYINPFYFVCRTWPNARDERKAIYKEFLTNVANISYDNLYNFLTFEGDKTINLSAADYPHILEMVTDIHEMIINENEQEVQLMK